MVTAKIDRDLFLQYVQTGLKQLLLTRLLQALIRLTLTDV